MKTTELVLDGIVLKLPRGWENISDELDEGTPFTLAKPDGVGALQFSPAIYEEGEAPEFSTNVLVEFMEQFEARHSLDRISEVTKCEEDLLLVAASFQNHAENDFVRVWYVTDRVSLLFATYTVAWDDQNSEIAECEQIMKSCRFRTK